MRRARLPRVISTGGHCPAKQAQIHIPQPPTSASEFHLLPWLDQSIVLISMDTVLCKACHCVVYIKCTALILAELIDPLSALDGNRIRDDSSINSILDNVG